MGKIINKDCDSLDIGELPVGGTHCSANWPQIWKQFKNKYPEVKEIVLDEKELVAFINGMYKQLLLENVSELKLNGVKIIKGE